jgi:hypothetical protein
MTVVDSLFDPRVVEAPYAYCGWLCDKHPVHRIAGTDEFVVAHRGLTQEVVADPMTFSASTDFLFIDANGISPTARLMGRGTGVCWRWPTPDHTGQRRVQAPVVSQQQWRAVSMRSRCS